MSSKISVLNQVPRIASHLVCLLAAIAISFTTVANAQAATVTEPYPRHVDLATLGTTLGLRGQAASEKGLPVSLTSDAADQLRDPAFRYEGFLLNTFLINGYATIRGEENTWHAYGVLVFEDLGGRRAYTQFSTYYRIREDGLEIYRATTRPLTPATPTFVWFAMRKDEVSAEMLAPENHAALVQLAGTKSLSTVPSAADEYVVFALSMDRFGDSEQVDFESQDQALNIQTLNLGGWPVGIFSGRIDPDNLEDLLSIQVSGGGVDYEKIDLPSFPTRPFVWE